MTKAYFLKNVVWGLLFGLLWGYLVHGDFAGAQLRIIYFILGLSAVLFPFARLQIEMIALKFTTRGFWTRGLFVDTPAKNGLYAIYYLGCYILAIPLGIAYLLINKKALPRKA